jgi:hypothetical protein
MIPRILTALLDTLAAVCVRVDDAMADLTDTEKEA